MNVFLRELKAHRKGLFFWSVGMIALVGSGMAKFEAYQSSGFSMNKLLAQFPKSMQILFGLNGFNLSKVSDFYGLLFLYIALMAAVHAVLLGAEIIAKEEREKTGEFLFTKPLSRARIMSAKVSAGITNVIILNLVTLITSLIAVDSLNKGASVTHDIIILMVGLFFLQLIFFTVGIAVAAVRSKPKTSTSIATSVLLAAFILSYVIDFNGRLDNLKYFTPFKYFDAKTLLTSGRLDPVYILLSIAVVMTLLVVGYTGFLRRDLDV